MPEIASPLPADAQAAIGRGDFAEAERLLSGHLSERRADVGAWRLLGNVQIRRGNPHAGLASYDRALALDPGDAQLWFQRGILLQSLRQWGAALQSHGRALEIIPNFAQAWASSAKILISLHRPTDALNTCQRGLIRSPCHPALLSEEAFLLLKLGRFNEALASFQKLLQTDPENRDARNGSAICLQKIGRLDEARPIFDELVVRYPDLAYLHYNRGTLLNDLRDYRRALICFDRAIALQPDVAEMHNNRGYALRCLHHLPQALAAHDRALSLDARDPHYHYNRALVLQEMGDPGGALASLETALRHAPENAEFLYAKATALEALKRFSEAALIYEQVMEINPENPYAFGGLAHVALSGCDWLRRERVVQALPARIHGGRDVIQPFTLLGYGISEADQLVATRRYLVSQQGPRPESPAWNAASADRPKLRLGYVSADYHDHATTYLLTGLIESHDRSKFDVHGISTGVAGEGREAQRLRGAFDAFHDVRFQSDEEIACRIHELEIDILIDLKGYTQNARPGIFAWRAAPVQIAWLGYAATSGGDDLDYLIADRFVLPSASEAFYTEKIIRLPTCYQANDDKREMAQETPSRSDLGLPQEAFVFCCFNNSWKITAPVFAVWMRLLMAIQESVLWLLDDNEAARANLLSAAKDHDVRSDRLVFAPRVPVASHLARHRLADLFLDTIPYNAHTGATDALWAGLPLLTCTGNSFAGRVATSLLHAVGLPDLISGSLDEYESRALVLARDSALLEACRKKLRQARTGPGLFDTNRFTSEIEAAYQEIWRAQGT